MCIFISGLKFLMYVPDYNFLIIVIRRNGLHFVKTESHPVCFQYSLKVLEQSILQKEDIWF